ncbi:MAG: hypothetical protein FJY65_10015, partial [Calditrichaeota bacterium]|nr:hypothetical protein [Calditrichota bacterium]
MLFRLLSTFLLIAGMTGVLYAQAGTALEFNGQTTYALIPRHNALNCPRITVEVWFKPAQCIAQDRWDAIVNKPYIVHQAPHYQWNLTRGLSGNVGVSFTIDGVSRGANSQNDLLQLGQWSHLAATYDGEFVRVFLNGEQVAQLEARGAITGYDTDLSIGQLGNFPNVALDKYNGIIDEVRVWNISRNAVDIRRSMNVRLSGREQGLVGYWNFDEGQGQRITDLSPTANHGRLGASDAQEASDPRWVNSDAPIYGGLAEISAEEIHFPPVAQGREARLNLTLRNVSEEDDEWHILEYQFTDRGGAPRWLTIEPLAGRIRVGELEDIVFTVNTQELNAGDYARIVALTTNARNMLALDIPVTITVVQGVGHLSGRVTDAANARPVEGALVKMQADYALERTTDEDGRYEFADLPAYNYRLCVTALDYLPILTESLEVRPDAEVERNFALLHSVCEPRPARLEFAVPTDDVLRTTLAIRNPGNGTLTWTAERLFPEQARADPWTLRANIPAGQTLGD